MVIYIAKKYFWKHNHITATFLWFGIDYHVAEPSSSQIRASENGGTAGINPINCHKKHDYIHPYMWNTIIWETVIVCKLGIIFLFLASIGKFSIMWRQLDAYRRRSRGSKFVPKWLILQFNLVLWIISNWNLLLALTYLWVWYYFFKYLESFIYIWCLC